ncbi:DUF2017 family protein [Microbacterium sp. NPDC089189]|uniref:DUF2017 family protein n=1 Tax=Microbacterium sp. NPDC089189 TaxID=3154972 RepID=UPI0034459275
MTESPSTLVEITRLEAVHLRGLVSQFVDLLSGTTDASSDPAVARLVPSAYPDDEEAAGQFRATTESELLRRRTADAAVVLADLATAGELDLQAAPAEESLTELVIDLDRERVDAWMRTLSAVRLVLASRLEITTEDDHDPSDPRFGVYDWLGYRLEGLISAVTPD